MSYTQAERPMRVQTALGADALLLKGLSGEEGVSRPFSYHLDLLSEDDAVAAADLLRTPVAVTLTLSEGDERTFHGLVRRFVQQGRAEELSGYQAEIVPWLWFLSLSRESRIHQNLSVPEILETVFRGLGHSDFELRCTKSYPKRDFCVQYRETHLDFVSRLMEEEGIFYFFEHTADRHLLVVADDNSAVKPCPGGASARMAPQGADAGEAVSTLHWEEQACIGKVVLRDYDFLQPSLKLESTIAASDPEEFYDYPGSFTAPDEGQRYARIRLEEAAALRKVVRGQSTCRAFQSGFRFDLAEHFRDAANQPYMIVQVQHTADAGDFRSGGRGPMDYRNDFAAVPHSVPFRPRRVTPHPVVHGSQTALVVGPAGEEVWVDSHGRIKVQFYWDRLGKKDENSSCWVRVAQPWAGKGYGSVQIPRIGSEVVVEFLEGDPNRPLVTGCVYNAEQTPPFALPGAAIQMGMKSRSSPGGGGANEITMTDTHGTEAMTIHAQYNMGTTVQNDQTNTINNNRTTSITTNDTTTVGAANSLTVGANSTESVGGSKTETVAIAKSLDIGAAYQVSVGAAMSETVGAVKMESVGGAKVVSVGSASSETVGGSKSLSASANISERAGGKIGVRAGGNIGMQAGSNLSALAKANVTVDGKKITLKGKTQITLKCGSASITLKSGGDILIKGTKITVKGSGPVKIKGSTIAEN